MSKPGEYCVYTQPCTANANLSSEFTKGLPFCNAISRVFKGVFFIVIFFNLYINCSTQKGAMYQTYTKI